MTGVGPGHGGSTPPGVERSSRWWPVLVPTAALLVGLLIGGVVVGVAKDGDDGASATSPQATDSPTASDTTGPESGATMVVVPDECLAAVETVEEVTELVRQGATAIRDFRPAALRSLLSELETLDLRAREQAQACRDVSVQQSPASE